ncbi:MAG: glycosyltransferase family 4 protein [Planctomycetota bacterium]
MKIGIVEPALASPARGNTVSVKRWRTCLERRGKSVRVLSPDELSLKDALQGLDVLHAHHAIRTGPHAAKAAEKAGIPWVLSIGGTDLALDENGKLDPRAADSFSSAQLVMGPNWADAERLNAFLDSGVAFQRVRRGVVVPPRALGVRPHGLRGLLAGGIREVKGQDIALDWFDAMDAKDTCQQLNLELLFAGPVIEEDYATTFSRRIERRNRLAWLGSVEASRMPRTFARSDFLLNSSRLEGGSNAILEAWAHGRPVVAKRSPGNVEMLESAPPSIAHLVADRPEAMDALFEWLQRLAAADSKERQRRARLARDYVSLHHDSEVETDELLRAYERARS